MEEFKNKNFASRLKDTCMKTFSKNKKKILTILVAVLVLIGIGSSLFYFLNLRKFKDESLTFSAIRKGELAGSGKLGSKVAMGMMEVTLKNVVEGTYRPLELDAQGNRITKKYFGAEIMIYNTGGKEKDFLVIGLTDEKGRNYERDREVEFYVDGLKDFGPAREIYPRTIREGHLIFQAPPDDAKKLQLTILSETTNKKVVFDIER